jgi:PBSX family phage terminase large subunit
MSDICIYDAIARPFWDLYDDLKRGDHAEYWLKGGRGSTKSSFISLAIIRGILADPDANAIIYRKVGNTIKDSVYSQMLWAIDRLELSPWFKCKVSPFEIIYTPTDQRILFRGADDPMKSKSIKLQKGYFK